MGRGCCSCGKTLLWELLLFGEKATLWGGEAAPHTNELHRGRFICDACCCTRGVQSPVAGFACTPAFTGEPAFVHRGAMTDVSAGGGKCRRRGAYYGRGWHEVDLFPI